MSLIFSVVHVYYLLICKPSFSNFWLVVSDTSIPLLADSLTCLLIESSMNCGILSFDPFFGLGGVFKPSICSMAFSTALANFASLAVEEGFGSPKHMVAPKNKQHSRAINIFKARRRLPDHWKENNVRVNSFVLGTVSGHSDERLAYQPVVAKNGIYSLYNFEL